MPDITQFVDDLPPGFYLMEEEDFIFLYYEKEKVTTFSAPGVDPRQIREEAEKYLHLRKLC